MDLDMDLFIENLIPLLPLLIGCVIALIGCAVSSLFLASLGFGIIVGWVIFAIATQ